MTLKLSPRAWSSVREPACFVLADVADDNAPLEVRIESPVEPGLVIGQKRMYAAQDRTLTVNVAPYVRTLLETTLFSASLRSAPVRVVVSGAGVATYTTPYVTLSSGRENLTKDTVLSARPADVVIGQTDWDEIALVTDGIVQPELVFVNDDGTTYVDTSMHNVASKETIVIPIDVVDCTVRIAQGAPDFIRFVEKFTLRLRITSSGGIVSNLERRYTVRKSPPGVRVAWVNRYGAVDFHTFPTVEKRTHRPDETLDTLLSGPVDDAGAEWLAEILSAPTVWRMDGKRSAELEVVGGEVVSLADQPTYVAIDVKPKK